MMRNTDQTKDKRDDGLPGVSKGVGGAGRVAGLLASGSAKDSKGTFSRLLKNVGPFKWFFITAIILTLLASGAQIFIPRLIGDIINIITSVFQKDIGLDWIAFKKVAIILVLLFIVQFSANYFSSVLLIRMTQKLIRSIRDQMQEKLNRLTLNYFDRSSTGDMISLLTNDLDNVSNTLQSGLTNSLTAIVILVGVAIMMFNIHVTLALLALIVVPVSYLLVKYLVKKAKPIFQRNANLTGHFNGQIEEIYNGEDIVKHYNLGNELKEEISALNERLYESEWKSSFVSFLTRPAGDLILNANYVLIAILGGKYVISGVLSLGAFQAFIRYTQMLRNPFTQVLGILNTIMSALASAERIFSFLDAEETVQTGMETIDIGKTTGEIEFNNVDFGYTDELLFKNVNLKVNPGEQLAIVGTTGAGKTTLVNLLMRFYEIEGGKIILDGHNTKRYHTDELRKAYSMVLQDTWLFSGTIRENIAYGATISSEKELCDVPLEEIKAAAKLAHADSFIECLPDGYDTMLTEGATNISQGERQLLTIARAMIKKAPIIILDEATSSVDTRTELFIQHAMKELTSNSTSFVIAHRLSTVHDADRIIVMDKGSIVEVGTHTELLDRGGRYAEMYTAGQL
ncbi:MAG TPA: ABC transporter ATP-binding protein [Bacteroidetes bacterium]|jgi:ATP-binding cassette subfamily B protein|nr:ABC transporter ATP-binding protein [Bacteroidota bacterium]